jgi:glycerophosphoryl diester phosphodiesterase
MPADTFMESVVRHFVGLVFGLSALWVAVTASAVINQGHRGTGTNSPLNPFPENTIPSFLQAFTEGADMVELDCTLSADDEVVVIHDDTLDRTTDCTGAVYDKTLAEIQACDAAVGTPLEGTGVVVPTLTEVFAALDAAKYTGEINIEIKSGLEGLVGADHLAARVVEEVTAAGWDARIIFSSFSLAILDEIELLDAAWVTAFITSEVNVNAQADLADAHALDGLHPYYAQTFGPSVTYAHDLGLFVNVWTVDLAFAMQTMIDREVDGIITNEPDVLYDLLHADDDDDDDNDNDNDDNNDDNNNDLDDDDDDNDDNDTVTDDNAPASERDDSDACGC